MTLPHFNADRSAPPETDSEADGCRWLSIAEDAIALYDPANTDAWIQTDTLVYPER